MLGGARWVTLVGPPGSGKTLLARHEARRHTDCVWLSAQRLHSLDALVSACLDPLDADFAPGDSPDLALKRALDGREVLLVLDGVDAVPGVGQALQSIVESTSAATILCTALSMAGQSAEQVLRVGPLRVPGEGQPLEGPAVELLLSQIAAAGGYPIDLARHEATVRRMLLASGGLPLLIEQLAVQIALVGMTDVVPTASLSEAVHASYELLDQDQKRCFRRLAQVDHPVSLEVLCDITDVPRPRAAELAAGLARRSLVEIQPDGRFDMLAPIRRHASLLSAATDDHQGALDGLLRWAGRVTPQDNDSGAGDAPWLTEVPLMRDVIEAAGRDSRTRPLAYGLANRTFSSLYTTMRARDALAILESVLASGDGPAEIGAQVARRAGICASEVRGTFEGLRFLDRAEQHALGMERPDRERARNAGIRAEMHLDAGALGEAQTEAEAAISMGVGDHYLTRQARRTLLDVLVSRGDFREASELAPIVVTDAPREEQWMALSARTLLGRIAFERGQHLEAAAIARAAQEQARELAEDRIALLAGTLYREIAGDPAAKDQPDLESLPWAVRLTCELQEARDLLSQGTLDRAAGRAADILVLAESSRLARDGVIARLLLGDALMGAGEQVQAGATYTTALRQAAACPLPLRAADALDGLAVVLASTNALGARQCTAAARSLRKARGAVAHPRRALAPPPAVARDLPAGWLAHGHLTQAGVDGALALLSSDEPGPDTLPLAGLTQAERTVAGLVSQGLTNRQIAEQLFISTRTVDSHLAHIFRKLDISSRARLAVLMTDRA